MKKFRPLSLLSAGLVAAIYAGVGLFAAVSTPKSRTMPAVDHGDATYVGEAVCMACHVAQNNQFVHTAHASAFRLNPKNELQSRSCEACHGPGSNHRRLDTMLRPNLDAGISGQLRDSDYPNSPYGRTGDNLRSANFDLYYQPTPRQSLYAFYSYQIGRVEQRSIQSVNANVIIGAASPLGVITPANAVEIGSAPGGPLFPLNNEWTAIHTDRNHVAGVGLKQDFGKASFNFDYSYTTGRARIVYNYTVGGAVNAATAPLAGNRMPDLATDLNYVDASIRIPLNDRVAARLVYRHQQEKIRDWHYRNLEANPVVLGAQGANALPTAVMLDGGPYNYTVNWFGVILQWKL